MKLTKKQELEMNLLLRSCAKSLNKLGIKDYCPICKADLPPKRRK